MTDCPSDADLSGFLNESLSPDKLGTVSIHVDVCNHCQNRLDKLTHDTDGAVARYKELSSVSFPRTNAIASSPEAGTLIIGVNALPQARLIGLPNVPGFDVLEEIGRGGMGVVYKARHRRLNRLVALKMVLAGGAADARLVQRFLFEAEILARVQHSQVVQVFEVDTYQGPSGIPIPYLAMELLEGGSLSKRLRERRDKEGRETSTVEKNPLLEPRVAAELIEGIARAVHSAHLQGVIHRDLKPGNILFGNDDVGPRSGEINPKGEDALKSVPSTSRDSRSSLLPKVTDFGLAKFTQDAGADLTGSGQVVGTPHYMAPEQAAGSRKIGPETDVYALGAILFECLTGRPPFEGSEPMSVLLRVVNEAPPDVRVLCRGLHQDLAAVVMRCLAKDLRRRYASAADLADDLRRYLEKRPTIARPVTFRERTWLWAKRNPAEAGLLITLGAVLFAAFIAVTAFWVKAEKTAIDERRAKEHATAEELRANIAQKQAEESLAEANKQKAIADRNQTYLEFARAVNWCEEGRVAQGIESFVRTVELAEAVGEIDVARVARINLAAWPKELPTSRKFISQSYQPRDIAFFPDGRRGVISSRGGNMFLWDTTTDQKVMTYRPSLKFARRSAIGLALGFTFWTAAVSPNGRTVVGSGTDGQVWVWDADKAEPRAALQVAPHDDDSWGLAFAPDGTLWTTYDAEIQCWNVNEQKIIARATLPKNSKETIQSLVASSDGKRLYTGDRSGLIQEWDAEQLKPLRWWKITGWATSLAFSPNETHLAVTGNSGFVQVFDLATGKLMQELSLSGAYGRGVAFSSKRSLLIASDNDGNVRGWNWKTGVPIGVPLQLSGEVLSPRFLPDSDEFAVSAGNSVYRCSLAAMPGQLLYFNNGRRIRGLDFSPGGDRLAIAHDFSLREFNLANGSSKHSDDMPTFSLALRYDPDRARNRLIRGFREGFDVVGLPDFVPSPTIRTGDRPVQFAFSNNGHRLFVLELDKVSLWDPFSLTRPIAQFRDEEMPNGVDHAALDLRPDGQELLLTFANKVVFLDCQTLKQSRAGWKVSNEISDAKYLPGGNKILVGRRDSVAQVYDATTGEPIGRPMTHTRAVLSMAISPNGKLLLTGSRDGTARFWDLASGLPLGPPLRHSGPVTHVGFNPDGTQVATGSGNGEVLLWTLPPPPIPGSIDELKKPGTGKSKVE
jgi:serine/threonine protein kinase/WD40 repeat protein